MNKARRWPILTGCDLEGTLGNCGPDCQVYLKGECPIADELEPDKPEPEPNP